MNERSLIDEDVINHISTHYFDHRKSKKSKESYHTNSLSKYYFNENYDELSKNDWELHKQYIKEGHNPNEIAKTIRNDEIEKLQEISSQYDFNFNQFIESSLYERCSFINTENVTLIDYAAFFSSVKCFKYLLMNNAIVKNTGKYAVAGGNEEIIHLCEQNHSSFFGSCEAAIKFHRNDIFKYIYENKLESDLNERKIEEFMCLCVEYGNYKILSFLEEKGYEIKDSIINESAKNGNIYLVKKFLQSNKPPNDILMSSSESGNFELLKYILEIKGIDVNAQNNYGNTALMIASYKDYIEIVKLLLEQEGIDINAKDKDGQTALILASYYGHTEIVQLLLEQKGIDDNTKDDDGKTALIFASQCGHIEIVKLLLEQEGIDINAKDKYGKTALILASYYGHTEIVKLLLEQEGIDINDKNNYGNTALIWSSENSHTEIVKLLLEQEGIDINAKDKYGKTALILASYKGYTEIVKMIEQKET